MSSTNAVENPSAATVATRRVRRAPTRLAPSTVSPAPGAPRRGEPRDPRPSSAPRSSTTGERPAARHAGHAAAATGIATLASQATASAGSNAVPGAGSFSSVSRRLVGPYVASTPPIAPSVAAGAATNSASSPCVVAR